MPTSGSTAVFGAGNFNTASDILFKVRVLTCMDRFSVLGAWLVTNLTGHNEMAGAFTVMLVVFELGL